MNRKISIWLSLSLLFTTAANAQVKFRADFESGSLGDVTLTDSTRFTTSGGDTLEHLAYRITTRKDPDNPADPELTPSRRWFYFLMTGVKEKEIALDIDYNDSKRPMYSYDGIHFTRFTMEEVPLENKTITKIYDRDSVYIAYFTPYTQSYLQKRISGWIRTGHTDTIHIGTSEYGREMPLLIITNPGPAKNKKTVYIHGRVHPSETPGSWHLDGMIEMLNSHTEYANDLRNNAVFYILPFTNPDGVWEGMSRSNGNGINLEVNWAGNEEVTSREVKNIRTFLQQLTGNGKPVDLFLNMHSQIAPNITYWIHSAGSTSGAYYKELMLLANLTISGNPYFFKKDLNFSKVASRYLEGWFWDNFKGRTLAVTFETPYTYYGEKPDGEWVTVENLQKAALYNLYAVGDYLGLGREDRVIADNPQRGRKVAVRKDNGVIYFGKSYLVSKKAGAKVKFKGKLPAGTYDVYKWQAGENLKISKDGENEWIRTGNFIQTGNGTFKYIYTAPRAGEKIDALVFIKKHKPLINRNKINVQSAQ